MDYRGTLEGDGADIRTTNAWAMVVRIGIVALGAMQVLILLRILLLIVGGDQGGMLLAAVMRLTGPFVEPFRNLLKLPAIPSNATAILDGAAVAAFIGWTAIEAFVIAYLAPRIDARKIDWPAEYDRRYGTIVVADADESEAEDASEKEE